MAPEVPEHERSKILARAKRVSIKQGQLLPESIMNHVRRSRFPLCLILIAVLTLVTTQLVWNLGKTDEPLVCPDGRPTVAHLVDLNDVLFRRKERRKNRKVNWGKLDAMGRKSN